MLKFPWQRQFASFCASFLHFYEVNSWNHRNMWSHHRCRCCLLCALSSEFNSSTDECRHKKNCRLNFPLPQSSMCCHSHLMHSYHQRRHSTSHDMMMNSNELKQPEICQNPIIIIANSKLRSGIRTTFSDPIGYKGSNRGRMGEWNWHHRPHST